MTDDRHHHRDQLDRVLDDAVAAAAALREPTARRSAPGTCARPPTRWTPRPSGSSRSRQEETHLPLPRLTGELKRTTFQLRLLRRRDRVGARPPRDDRPRRPGLGHGAAARPAPDAGAARTRGRLGGEQLPVRVLRRRRRHRLRARGRLPGRARRAPGPPAAVGGDRGGARSPRSRAPGRPRGVFALVEGQEAGRALITDPRIAAGAFTGSLRGGRALFDLASARPMPIPFYGELGSVNPAFVTAGRGRRASRRGRGGVRRVADPRRRPVLHEAGAAVRAGRTRPPGARRERLARGRRARRC